MSIPFLTAAKEFHRRGWLSIPLTYDHNNLPKKPIALGWTSLDNTIETIEALPWAEARGIGIVLGAVSHNLAAIDIDHLELSKVLLHELGGEVAGRTVLTIRQRCHLYCYEEFPTRSRDDLVLSWKGERIPIEIKASGRQVVAPPTPGYRLIGKAEPPRVRTIGVFLNQVIALVDGLALEEVSDRGSYPTPWQAQVAVKERNKSAYVEAHKLRESGMSLALALDIMEARYSAHYAKGEIRWEEIKRTVESAYQRNKFAIEKVAGEDEHRLFA